MKIQCDVCNKHHASFFCTADEAALCDGCDHRVHHANKLASKHQRFSLSHPSTKHYPLCDICQERRAYVFCQQDRAILCKECDFPIHSANDLTKKHNRFLLTGIKLSPTATFHSSLPSNSSPKKTATFHSSPPSNSPPKKNPLLHSSQDSHPPSMSNEEVQPESPRDGETVRNLQGNIEEAGLNFTSSSISEYLMNTIPGWKFEDFLDSPSFPFACSKSGDDMLSLLDEGNMISFSGMWVPQAPSSVYCAQMDQQNGTREGSNRSSRLRDDNFIVPQLSPPTFASKRPRPLW